MIVRLRGPVIETDGSSIVVDCNGVGYEVFVPESVAIELGIIGTEIDLYVRQVFRENDVTLYGFINAQQRSLFDLLRDVKGCGSKTSLAVISTLGESGTVQAIINQDAKTMTKPPGVGPRLAERIIVDLKEKVVTLNIEYRAATSSPQSRFTTKDDELTEALLALGYRRGEVDQAASIAREKASSIEDQLKIALQRLAK